MKKKEIIINCREDIDAFYETIYLLSQNEVIKDIKEGEKEDVSHMKVYNPKEPW